MEEKKDALREGLFYSQKQGYDPHSRGLVHV